MFNRRLLIALLDLSLLPLGAAITRTAIGHNNNKPAKSVTSWTPLTSVTLASGDSLFVGLALDVNYTGSAATWNGIAADGTGTGGADVLVQNTNGTEGILFRWSDRKRVVE